MKFDASKKDDIVYVVQWLTELYGQRDPDEEEVGDIDMYELFDKTEIDSEVCDESGVRAFLVYEQGGYEGGGEVVQRVLAIAHKDAEVEEHNSSCLIKDAYCSIAMEGYYASYDGIAWHDDWHFVKRKIVTQVVFA